MNITKELKDELNAVVKVLISKDDYEPNVQKVLDDYRKKAKIDGFRPGKVPAGMIRKLYGKSVMVEEINKLLSEKLIKYIQDEHIHILGEPLPSDKEQKPIDWDNSSEFEFAFDLGLSPEFELSLSKKLKLTSYSIKPDPKLITTYSENYTRRYGSFKTRETIEDGNEMLKGTFIEMNADGTVKDRGISVQDSTIYLEFMKDDDIKKQFMGLKSKDTVSFNLRKAYPNNVELASILHRKKEEVAGIDSDFQFTLEVVSKFENAPVDQDLFDKIYGEGNVTSMEEFHAKVGDEIRLNLSRESDYKFRVDTKATLLKNANFSLPVDFLKRWIFSSNEGKFTMDQINQEFVKFEGDLKWQLIQDKIIKEHDLKLTDEEILDFAKDQTRLQFEQYGLFNVPDEQINTYAQESLKREEDRRKMVERRYEDKVLDFIRETVTIDQKEVTPEAFDKLMEEESNQ